MSDEDAELAPSSAPALALASAQSVAPTADTLRLPAQVAVEAGSQEQAEFEIMAPASADATDAAGRDELSNSQPTVRAAAPEAALPRSRTPPPFHSSELETAPVEPTAAELAPRETPFSNVCNATRGHPTPLSAPAALDDSKHDGAGSQQDEVIGSETKLATIRGEMTAAERAAEEQLRAADAARRQKLEALRRRVQSSPARCTPSAPRNTSFHNVRDVTRGQPSSRGRTPLPEAKTTVATGLPTPTPLPPPAAPAGAPSPTARSPRANKAPRRTPRRAEAAPVRV